MSSAIGSVGGSIPSQNLLSISENSTNTRKTSGTSSKPPDPSEMFSKIDTNGDGKVSKDELTAFQKLMEKNAPTKTDGAGASKPPDASQMLTDMDTNGDGTVSKDEFTTFTKNMEQQMQAKGSQVLQYNDQGEDSTVVQSKLLDVRV